MLWQWLKFNELTSLQLYELLRLREQVFTLEQKCAEEDLDGLDIDAIHLLGYEKDKLFAYARLLPPTHKKNYISFGRLAAAKEQRGTGLGKEMMHKIIIYINEHFSETVVKISAQYYLKKFYEDFGFSAYGEPYDEGGIKHIGMRK